jgi:hypothetical protein
LCTEQNFESFFALFLQRSPDVEFIQLHLGFSDTGFLDEDFLDEDFLDGDFLDGDFLDGDFLDGDFLDTGFLYSFLQCLCTPQ